MEQEDILVGAEDVQEILGKGEIEPLSDIHSIESVIDRIKHLDDEISSLRKLKKKRAKAIDSAIDKTTDKIGFLKDIIYETLDHFKERQVRFPGVGMVSKRKSSTSYKIVDQDSLLKTLKEEGEYDNVVSTSSNIDVQKHKLNKLLSLWDKIGKLPPSVKIEKSERSVTISFAKEDEQPEVQEETTSELQELDFS